MPTQTVAFPEDHQGIGDLDVVRQKSNTNDSSGGPQRRKLRENNQTHRTENPRHSRFSGNPEVVPILSIRIPEYFQWLTNGRRVALGQSEIGYQGK